MGSCSCVRDRCSPLQVHGTAEGSPPLSQTQWLTFDSCGQTIPAVKFDQGVQPGAGNLVLKPSKLISLGYIVYFVNTFSLYIGDCRQFDSVY